MAEVTYRCTKLEVTPTKAKYATDEDVELQVSIIWERRSLGAGMSLDWWGHVYLNSISPANLIDSPWFSHVPWTTVDEGQYLNKIINLGRQAAGSFNGKILVTASGQEVGSMWGWLIIASLLPIWREPDLDTPLNAWQVITRNLTTTEEYNRSIHITVEEALAKARQAGYFKGYSSTAIDSQFPTYIQMWAPGETKFLDLVERTHSMGKPG